MSAKIPFETFLNRLADHSQPFDAHQLERFSDLNPQELAAFKARWATIEAQRRLGFLDDLLDRTVDDNLVDFDLIALHALDDPEGKVRAKAMDLLESNLQPTYAHKLIRILNEDPSPLARAAAAQALGTFVYEGEVETIDAKLLHEAVEALLQAFKTGQDDDIRRKALISLGYSSTEAVPLLIQSALGQNESSWTAAALTAMGRSNDNVWEKNVLAHLNSRDADVQLAAVKAAGELQLDAAKPVLFRLAEEDGTDYDVRLAAIWSVSEIGGEEVRDVLERCLEEADEDDELSEHIRDAMDNLQFNEESGNFAFLDLDPEELVQSGRVVDLEHPEEDEEERDEE